MNALEKLGDATRMLSEIRSAGDAKKLADMASAAEYYAKKAKLGERAVTYAHAIKVDALALLGGFLKKAEKRGPEHSTGGGSKGSSRQPLPGAPATLADLGITKEDSAAAQKIHELKEKKPEQFEAIKAGEKTVKVVKQEERREAKQVLAEKLKSEPMPEAVGPFHVIVIDPPWKYENRSDDLTHRGRCPYPDMSIDEIKSLPVAQYAHDNCIVWLWTTNAFMRESFECLDAWGLQNKTILTWVKDRMGLGDWLRGQTEHCLMAVRGRPLVTLTSQTTALMAPLREHSRKPSEFYSLVEALCPGSKLEMFAREPRPGWQAWGAEASKFAAV